MDKLMKLTGTHKHTCFYINTGADLQNMGLCKMTFNHNCCVGRCTKVYPKVTDGVRSLVVTLVPSLNWPP